MDFSEVPLVPGAQPDLVVLPVVDVGLCPAGVRLEPPDLLGSFHGFRGDGHLDFVGSLSQLVHRWGEHQGFLPRDGRFVEVPVPSFLVGRDGQLRLAFRLEEVFDPLGSEPVEVGEVDDGVSSFRTIYNVSRFLGFGNPACATFSTGTC